MTDQKNGEGQRVLDRRNLYRLPWNLTDNAIGWLEITTKCDLYCKGCHRENTNDHKSIREIEEDIAVLARYRTFQCLAISGGEPLLHPEIVKIVRLAKDKGWMPKIFTNGNALTEKLLEELCDAGLSEMTIHIDSKQNRPGWEGKNETELNELRLRFAKMAARTEIACNFNVTVFEDNVEYVPKLVKWAQEHIDVVGGMNFIIFRAPRIEEFDYFVDQKKIDTKTLAYAGIKNERQDITTNELVAKILEVKPDFKPCAYLSGTEKPDSLKWLFAIGIGTRKGVYGYIGPRMIELVQSIHHFFEGRYAFRVESPKAWKWILLGLFFDAGMRKALMKHLLSPRAIFEKLKSQAIGFVQAPDILPGGEVDLCDGCPDMCVWNGTLVRSCRLDEYLKLGKAMQIIPKSKK